MGGILRRCSTSGQTVLISGRGVVLVPILLAGSMWCAQAAVHYSVGCKVGLVCLLEM